MCQHMCGRPEMDVVDVSVNISLSGFHTGFPTERGHHGFSYHGWQGAPVFWCLLLISTCVTGTQTDFSLYVGTEDLCKSHFTH